MVVGVAGAALADTITYPTTPSTPPATTAAGTVNVSASVNPKITLTITTPDTALDGITSAASQTLDFQALEPGETSGALVVGLAVTSNKEFSLIATPSLGANWATNGLTLNRTFVDVPVATPHAKGAGVPFVDSYTITVPGDADPTSYTATVLYTATQI